MAMNFFGMMNDQVNVENFEADKQKLLTDIFVVSLGNLVPNKIMQAIYIQSSGTLHCPYFFQIDCEFNC